MELVQGKTFEEVGDIKELGVSVMSYRLSRATLVSGDEMGSSGKEMLFR